MIFEIIKKEIYNMAVQHDYSAVYEILSNHDYKQVHIISILQEIQEVYHYLPREVFPYLAEKLGMSEARIYSIATFYENFSLEPKGKYVIKICDGTACHVRKSIPILERLRQELGLSESKKTTDDLCFTLETVSCLGACGLAPVLTVNDVVYPEMTPDKATALLKQLKEEMENA
jgi:NADH-quinone oxidoreductase subunit E